MLNECPYLDLIALKLLRNEVSSKLETRKMVSSEQNREPIMDKIQIKEETSRPKQVDAGSAPDYFTSDEESDSSIRRRIAQKPKERTIKFHRNVNKPLKNQTPRDTKESGNTDPVITGAWSIEDLIKLVTTLTKNTNEGNRARFPEIKIPIYNGDKHKYEEFWAVFHQMVHSNISFSPIEKFLYLTNSLTDKAAEAIRGTRIIVENYQQAIDIIKEKFAVGRDISKDSDPLWKEIIYDKFPSHIREKVYMAMKRDKETKWTINKMISYIDDLIAARETYEVGEDAESNKKPYQNDTKRMAYKSNPITSRFCQQGHKDDERKTHRTPEERRNSLRNRMICWKCFSTYHTSWKCTRPNCSQCGKEHHRLLCLGNSPELPNTTHNRETSPSSNNGVYVDFDCPVFPLASLHKRYETTLPITMPRLRLYTENSELIAETEQMEATIAISSFMSVQLSVLVDSPPCSISLSPIQGCYRCLEGAEIIAFCKSDKSAIVELRCADKSFAIQCDPSPKKQILKFHYNSAIILDTCESSCGNKNVSLVVE
uniref:Integrase catalytic domain-containing protein n=1 Tax=Heterorhabditis bacteriophora TaxID=37862 RepID=A0A1I7X2C2_HETBA